MTASASLVVSFQRVEADKDRDRGLELEPGQEIVVQVIDNELTEVVRERAEAAAGGADNRSSSRPHALFWISLVLLIPGVLAADAADGSPPAVALRSE